MPTTINGVGTHYYGKQNLETRHATCNHCGRAVDLQTYDTRLWFCVIYIPVIPLGKKRILDECPACTRHSAVGQTEWEELRSQAISETTSEYEADPENAQKAIAVHATLASGGERAAAGKFADMMLTRFADNTDVLLYLGGAFEETNQLEQSNQCFHRLYEINSKDHTAQQVSTIALLREGKTDAARARLAEAEQSGQGVDAGVAFSVATALHQENNSAEAATVLRRLGETAPELQREKAFRQLAKNVEKATGEPRSIAAKQAVYKTPAFWWSIGAAMVVACLLARDAYLSNHQSLFVVNGLPRTITVEIDAGEAITVAPQQAVQLSIAGGSHKAQVTSPALAASETTFEIDSSRTSRWIRQPVHVLDPTRSAVVLWEETIYSERPVDEATAYEIVVGQPLTSYDNADYLFKEFPNKLNVDDTTEQVRKSRVGLQALTPAVLVIYKPEWLDDPEILDFFETHLPCEEATEQSLRYYVSAASNHNALERCHRFLESHLDKQPLDIAWHKMFQVVAAWQGEETLKARYDGLLADEPNDPTLLYLRGRLETSGQAATPFYRRAVAQDPQHPQSIGAIGYTAATMGDFVAALESLEQALAIDENVSNASDLRNKLMIALAKHTELEAELAKQVTEPPFNYGAVQTLMTSQATRNRIDLAQQTHGNFTRMVAAAWPEDPHHLVAQSAMHLHLLSGDKSAALQTAKSFTDVDRKNSYLVLCGLLHDDLAAAEQIIPQLPSIGQGAKWVWLSLASQTRDQAASDRYRRLAAQFLEKHANDSAVIARLLLGDLEPDAAAQTAYNLESEPDLKAAVLLLVADSAGEQSARLVELAERLSLLPSDYQPLLKAAIAGRKG